MSDAPTEARFHGSAGSLHYFEWGGEAPEAPVVLLVHATGFHARCWDQTVAALPPGYRVVALDMRGHGRSDKIGPYTWERFSRDLAEFVDHLGLGDAIGVGHSMGGHCITYAAALRPKAFSRLLLVDPVILPPEVYGDDRRGAFAGPEEHPVARRRNHWASWQEMYERFVDRAPFSTWQPAVLADYCRYGVLPNPLVPNSDGAGWMLACPPLVEASIYFGSSGAEAGSNIYTRIAEIDIPVVVLRARPRDFAASPNMDFSTSPTWDQLAAQFKHGRDVPLARHNHFIPMQDPALVANFICDPDARAPG